MYKATHSDQLNHDKEFWKQDILQYIPQPQMNSCGAILSRLIGVNQGLELGTRKIQESCMLFRKMLGTFNEKTPPLANEGQFTVLVEGFLLAIAQAAAYIRKTKISISHYIILFRQSEDKQSKLSKDDFDDPYRPYVPNSVMRTWAISVRQVSSVAQLILNRIAFLDHQGLLFEIIQAAAGPEASEDKILLVAWSTYRIFTSPSTAVSQLWLSTYEQHRLIQVAMRNSLSEDEIACASGKAPERRKAANATG